ncbi:hypothetical protein GPECTOR_23g138 [Gonium pectorale]|uniref:Uncharacterized protein n=1 Tax=Gonium pectorale TaxID=33097 RepID=A0A150GGT0_GONPE|nr:hypothetical protein GPECTOR_23g138 [Gonium pectorale]|eukprot:KXZ49052.1 hypothetical protein GPECTOR_23g138 [Gonium pectorale]
MARGFDATRPKAAAATEPLVELSRVKNRVLSLVHDLRAAGHGMREYTYDTYQRAAHRSGWLVATFQLVWSLLSASAGLLIYHLDYARHLRHLPVASSQGAQ